MKIREMVAPLPLRRYDPNNNEEDKKRLQETILKLVDDQLGRKSEKK